MTYVVPGVPPELCEPFDESIVAAALTREGKAAVERLKDQFVRGRAVDPLNAKTQPRDRVGRFRQVLARLRYNLGDSELENIVNEIKSAERLADVGDLKSATEAGRNVVQMVDEIKSGVLDDQSIINVRAGARELGKVLAYLPLPQGTQAEKVRFSDLPGATRTLVQEMIKRVDAKLGSDAKTDPTVALKKFMAGGQTMSSDDLSAELNRLLQYLT